jgi:hypothetical protein
MYTSKQLPFVGVCALSTIPLADLINNQASECVERQITEDPGISVHL